LRRALIVGVLTLLHFLGTLALTVVAFGRGMAELDSGLPPTATGQVLDVLTKVFLFPIVNGLVTLLPRSITGAGFPVEHLLFLLNSLIWALAVLWVATSLRRRRTRNGSSATDSGA
jgi:hypothetical protein